ncbi:MAG: hypothetical protein ACLFNU_10050 [Bacteroidales bacterium]
MIIKKLGILLMVSVLIYSCSKDETPLDEQTPIVADFELTVTGEAPDAVISIENKSTGATDYEWIFGQGANIESSPQQSPSELNVDKAGTFSVVLKASSGSEEKTKEKSVNITGYSAIYFYENVHLGYEQGIETYGRLFSSSTGLVYKDGEVDEDIGGLIDFGYTHITGTNMGLFASPDDENENFGIPNAQTTKIRNWVRDEEYNIEDFDDIENDSGLSDLDFEEDDDLVPMNTERVVFFENGENRKGIIKVKGIEGYKVIADIKVQKY